MRFASLHLARYGRFTDQTVEFPQQECDFHLILGRNEAGKSTLRQALHDLLFGIPMTTPMSFLHPGAELALNAVITSEAGELAFGRRRKRNGGLVDSEGEPLPAQTVSDWLGDVNEAFYERMFGLDHKRLEAGSHAMLQAGDNVDAVLFQAAAGVSALNGILESLQQEASALWAPRRSRDRAWYVAATRLAEAESDLKAATVRPSAWADAQRENRRLQEAFEQAQAQHSSLVARVRELERLRRTAPQLAQLRQYEAFLASTHDSVSPFLQRQDDILQLRDMQLRVASHSADIEACGSRLSLLWRQLEDVLRQLGWPSPGPQANVDTLAWLAARLPPKPQRHEIVQLLQEGRQLAAQRDAAQQLMVERVAERDSLRAGIDALPSIRVSQALRQALEAASVAGDIETVLQKARQVCGQKEAVLTRRLQAVADGTTDRDAAAARLSAMSPWPHATLQDQIQRHSHLQADIDALEQRLREARLDFDTAELELAQFRRSHQAVTRDEVLAARRDRNLLWEQFVRGDATLQHKADQYATLTLHADTLADQHLSAVGDAARLQVLQHRQERCATLLHGLEEARSAAVQRLQAHGAQWEKACASRALPLLAPSEIQGWQLDREAALTAYDEWQGAKTEVNALAQQYAVLLQDLGSALNAEAGSEPSPGGAPTTLGAACDTARRHLAAADQVEARRDARADQLARIESQLPALHREADRRDADYAAWLQRRSEALGRAGLSSDASDAYIEAALSLLSDADQLTAQLRETLEERERMVNELHRYVHAAARLANVLGDASFVETDTDASLQRWLAQVEHMRQEARAREDAQARVAELTLQLLAEGEGRSRQALEAELDAVDISALSAQSEVLSASLEEAASNRSRLAVECEQAKRALDAISGDERAAHAEARRQEALADMAGIAERYVQVHAQSRLLERVMERYRERRQGPLLARAGQLFSRLTLGAHAALVVDDEAATLHARRADGRLTPLAGLSDGTRDQLYLSLRLAALELYLDNAPAMPFIADDLFVNYDDGRSRAGLTELAGVARRTQVIYLTHHAHLVELARETLGDRVRVIELIADEGAGYTGSQNQN